jgi:hypothetical protein
MVFNTEIQRRQQAVSRHCEGNSARAVRHIGQTRRFAPTSHVSHLNSHVSHPTSYIPNLTSHVSHLTTQLSASTSLSLPSGSLSAAEMPLSTLNSFRDSSLFTPLKRLYLYTLRIATSHLIWGGIASSYRRKARKTRCRRRRLSNSAHYTPLPCCRLLILRWQGFFENS